MSRKVAMLAKISHSFFLPRTDSIIDLRYFRATPHGEFYEKDS